MEIDIGGLRVRIIDMGGARNERKKWIHCFENVAAVVYVASLAEYDQMLYEDVTANRMLESLKVFEEVVNSRWFTNSVMMLIFNKNDTFREKIEKYDPKDFCFPVRFPSIATAHTAFCVIQEYDGGLDYDRALSFIRERFLEKNVSARPVYTHVACATDMYGTLRLLFNALQDLVIRKQLSDLFI